MDFNGIIFPSPNFDYCIEGYENDLIFIPKNSNKSVNNFIPCLFLQAKMKVPSKYYLFFFHGNAEDVFIAKDIADKLRDCLYVNVVIIEYPGYSIYKAEKDSNVILEDCLTVFDFFTNNIKIEPENIFAFGRSIGSGPATYLSSQRKPGALILMSPFTSLRDVVENLVGNLMKFLVSERFENIEYIKNVTCPIMFIHGQLDTLVPFEHTIKLKDNCNCPYELLMPEDMDHNNFHYDLDFIFPLKDFLKRHTLFKIGETCEIDFPSEVQEIPKSIKEIIHKERSKIHNGTFQNCFGVSN